MPGQAFVDEGVVGRQQIDGAAAFAQDAVEEQFGFPAERLAQVVVEIGKQLDDGQMYIQTAQPKPLSGEVLRKRSRSLVGEHSLHLTAKYAGLAQSTLLGDSQQFIVGNAAPQEKRQPGSQFKIADPVSLAGHRFPRLGLGPR